MNLIALPAFTDNHIWMFHDGRRAVVVDPGESAPVLAARHLTLAAILVTHHHADHVGGDGRLFKGTPTQMHESLSRLAELPADSRVCCGHEYTFANLRFARAVEPGNTEVTAHTAWNPFR